MDDLRIKVSFTQNPDGDGAFNFFVEGEDANDVIRAMNKLMDEFYAKKEDDDKDE